MITEQELERALTLKDQIKDLSVFISKLEHCKIAAHSSMNAKVNIDNNLIDVNEYTIATLKRFHHEIINDHRHKLHKLEEEYKAIIYSPEEAFELALHDVEDDNGNEEAEKT